MRNTPKQTTRTRSWRRIPPIPPSWQGASCNNLRYLLQTGTNESPTVLRRRIAELERLVYELTVRTVPRSLVNSVSTHSHQTSPAMKDVSTQTYPMNPTYNYCPQASQNHTHAHTHTRTDDDVRVIISTSASSDTADVVPTKTDVATTKVPNKKELVVTGLVKYESDEDNNIVVTAADVENNDYGVDNDTDTDEKWNCLYI